MNDCNFQGSSELAVTDKVISGTAVRAALFIFTERKWACGHLQSGVSCGRSKGKLNCQGNKWQFSPVTYYWQSTNLCPCAFSEILFSQSVTFFTAYLSWVMGQLEPIPANYKYKVGYTAQNTDSFHIYGQLRHPHVSGLWEETHTCTGWTCKLPTERQP